MSDTSTTITIGPLIIDPSPPSYVPPTPDPADVPLPPPVDQTEGVHLPPFVDSGIGPDLTNTTVNQGLYGGSGSDAQSYSITTPTAGNEIYATADNVFVSLVNAVNSEVYRRSLHSVNPAISAYPSAGASITAADINKLWTAITTAPSYPYSNSAIFSGVSANSEIYASDLVALANFINAAGAVCLCNCNYCTCNCNYCTCNCNYCTCNCNYCTCNCNYCTCNCNYACTCNCNYACTCNCNYACTCNCNYCTCNCNYCTCNCNYSCTCNCNYASDERLKENIKFVEKRNDINIYTWNYIWDKETTCLGVIAQELLDTKYANAINIGQDGYYTVNYSKLPNYVGNMRIFSRVKQNEVIL